MKGYGHGILDSLGNSDALKGVLGQLEAAVIPAVLGDVLGNAGRVDCRDHRQASAGRPRRPGQILDRQRPEPPITADNCSSAGSDTVRQLAAKFTFRSIQLAKMLAEQLPAPWTTPAPTAGCASARQAGNRTGIAAMRFPGEERKKMPYLT